MCGWVGTAQPAAYDSAPSSASTMCSTGRTWGRWLSTRRMGAIMSRLRAGTCMSGSRWVQGNSRRLSTEVGMMHWARWSAAVAVAGLVAAPLCGQGSGGVGDPSGAPHAVVTNDMLLNPVATACCGPNNRGVAVSGGSVFLGTLDDNLVALDATTGKVKWEVKVGDGPAAGYTETMAPLVIGDNVIIGTSGAEYGIRGYVKAFSAANGAPVWTWYSPPDPQHGGWWGKWSKTTWEGDDLKRDIAKEKADSAKYADAWKTGGGSMWMTPAYDDATKTLFVAIGNPSPDLDGSIRPGDNLWTESIVAINATNGEFKWGYQEVPHDVWDLDAVSPPVIAMVGGKKAVVEAGKTGFVYVLDAATGKLIRRSAAFVPQQNMYTQPTADGVFMLPGANGGQEWSPIAVHPELAYAYTVGLHQPMHYKVHYAPWEKGRLWLGSAFIRVPDEKGGYSGEYGLVSAIDLNTGKIAWQQKTELPMMGGATATAGGLVFTGEGNGWFKAYDAKTGTVLWKFYCGAGVNAAPSVYELDGEQFIAVAAGGNFQISYPLGNSVFIFGLPKAGM